MIIYIKPFWYHNDKNLSLNFYSELDNNYYELRKAEIFINHQISYATEYASRRDIMLGKCLVSLLNEIHSVSEFKAEEITGEEFVLFGINLCRD